MNHFSIKSKLSLIGWWKVFEGIMGSVRSIMFSQVLWVWLKYIEGRFVIFLLVLFQVKVRSRLRSAVSRSAPQTSSRSRLTWTRLWMASTLSFARRFGPTRVVHTAPPKAAGATWFSTRPCWALVTSWARGTAPKTDQRPPHTRPFLSSPATTTAASIIIKLHQPPQAQESPVHRSTHGPTTCSVACLETRTFGLLRTSFRRAKWRGRGLLLIIITCQCR